MRNKGQRLLIDPSHEATDAQELLCVDLPSQYFKWPYFLISTSILRRGSTGRQVPHGFHAELQIPLFVENTVFAKNRLEFSTLNFTAPPTFSILSETVQRSSLSKCNCYIRQLFQMLFL